MPPSNSNFWNIMKFILLKYVEIMKTTVALHFFWPVHFVHGQSIQVALHSVISVYILLLALCSFVFFSLMSAPRFCISLLQPIVLFLLIHKLLIRDVLTYNIVLLCIGWLEESMNACNNFLKYKNYRSSFSFSVILKYRNNENCFPFSVNIDDGLKYKNSGVVSLFMSILMMF